MLHDFVLHHLVAGLTIGRRDGHGYLDAMEREGGVVGRLLGHAVLDKRIPPLWESRPEDFHLAGRGARPRDRPHRPLVLRPRPARAAGYAGPVWVDPASRVPGARGAAGRRLGRARCSARSGTSTRRKRVPQLLEAFSRVRGAQAGRAAAARRCRLAGFDLDRRLQRLGLDGAGLVREGYVDEARLWALMKACDVHVSLRSPTMGETSGTAIRALALGKPLVVSDVGWFAELPGDVALKVPVDDGEVETLAAALELLASRPDVRAAMGAAALELARREHDLDRVAELVRRRRSSRRRAAAAVDDAVLARRQRGGRRGGDRARLAGGARDRRAPRRGRAR